MVAAGHPLTARAGADVLRAGGNAVDAAIAAMLVSWVAEPLLTGPGAGGYLLYAAPPREPVLLDFFVSAPGLGVTDAGDPAAMLPVDVDFGDARQTFNVGPASCGTWGTPAGIEDAHRRWGSVPLAELAAPAAALARAGVPLNAEQAYVAEILRPILTSTPECAALLAPGGRVLREGDAFVFPELGDAIERLGAEGAAPFYTGEIGAAIQAWLADRGGSITPATCAATRSPRRRCRRPTGARRAVAAPAQRGRRARRARARPAGPRPVAPSVLAIVDTMEEVHAARTDDFLDGLAAPGSPTACSPRGWAPPRTSPSWTAPATPAR